MKKSLKSFLALFLTLAMSLGVMGSIAFAEDKVSIDRIEADNDSIRLYFAGKNYLDLNKLNESISLQKEGNQISDFVVNRVNRNYSGGSATSDNFYYEIKPAEGIISDTVYDINISNLYGVNDFNKRFSVDELLYDDFKDGIDNWEIYCSNATKATIEVENGMLKFKGASNGAGVLRNIDWKNQTGWSDYTLSFDYKPQDANANNRLVCGPYNSTFQSTGYQYFINDAHTRIYYGSNLGWEFCTYSDGFSISTSNMNSIKISSYDLFGQLWVNGQYLINPTTKIASDTTQGAPVFYSLAASDVIYLDNIKVTKFVDFDKLGELTFSENYEADGECITVYPSQQINPEEMKKAITLKEDGKPIDDIFVEKVTCVSGYSSQYSNPIAYKITKTGGLLKGRGYQMKINSLLKSSDKMAVLNDDYNISFSLAEILRDDFSGTTDNWQLMHTNPSVTYQGNNNISIDNGTLKIATGSSYAEEHILVPSAYSEMMSLSDYTIEFDMEVVNEGDAQNNFKFYLSSSNNTNKAAMHVQNNGIRGYVLDDGQYEYTKNSNVASGMNHYKYVAINGRYQLYLNNEKIIDYTNEAFPTTGALAIAFFGNNGEYKLDNVEMTKISAFVKKVGMSDLVLTNGQNEVIDSIKDCQTVNINLNALNTFDDEKSCVVIAAVFDSQTNLLKNVSVADAESLVPGITPIEFKNYQVNGADQLKIFAIEGYDNIKPYCKPITK